MQPNNSNLNSKIYFLSILNLLLIPVYSKLKSCNIRDLSDQIGDTAYSRSNYNFSSESHPEIENNQHWLIARYGKIELFVYRKEAYYDERTSRLGSGATVRIFTLSHYVNLTDFNISCEFWDMSGSNFGPVQAETTQFVVIKKKPVKVAPIYFFLLSCPVPPGRMPDRLTLTLENTFPSLSPTPSLQIWNPSSVVDTPAKNFVVCVKGLTFPSTDISLRLIEWLEMLKLLEADHVDIYVYDVTPNVEKVLRHYETEGFVSVIPISLPGGFPNDPIKRNTFLHEDESYYSKLLERIAWNDCLYRNLNKYKYIVPLDTDELIVPTLSKISTWTELMDYVQYLSHILHPNSVSNIATYFVYDNGYFFEEVKKFVPGVPGHMHMLQHVYFKKYDSPPIFNVKGFMDVKNAVALHTHQVDMCVNNSTCGKHRISLELAIRPHYTSCGRRETEECQGKHCKNLRTSCSNYSVNPVLQRWKNALIPRVSSKIQLIEIPVPGDSLIGSSKIRFT